MNIYLSAPEPTLISSSGSIAALPSVVLLIFPVFVLQMCDRAFVVKLFIIFAKSSIECGSRPLNPHCSACRFWQ
jgi:hypothetical protein